MKKIILTLAIFLGFVLTIQAQENEAFRKDAIKLAKIGSKTAEASLDQVYTMIPEENIENFKKELQPIMQGFYQKLGEESMKYYTHEEVKDVLEFYETEIGQKHLEVQEQMTKAAMGSMAQEHQMKLMPIMQKYMKGQ